ncbi:MAG: hypothetical protein ABUT39_01205 [Acidobacteriota bacterium]
MRVMDRFSGEDNPFGGSDYRGDFWLAIHKRLQYLHGVSVLAPEARPNSPPDDAIAFLTNCSDDHFLDFIELIFKLEFYWRAVRDENSLVDDINHFFELDALPYALTSFVREERIEDYRGTPTTASYLTEFPRVIRRDSQVTHAQAVAPALQLLADKRFASANREFLEALEDFRKRDYDDCLVKCGSAFESALKLICETKGWPYKQSDTAKTLLQTVISNSTLDPYFEQPLLVIAILRNRESTAHGAGVHARNVPPQRAQFAINATAAGILLVVQECL